MQEFDLLHRFLIDHADVRGEMVRLQDSLNELLNAQPYPTPVKQLLAEMVTVTSLLTATLKFEGEIALQIQSEGIVKYAVVNGNNQQQMRGVAKWEQDTKEWPNAFSSLFDKGVMVITITPNEGERYQGMVALDKPTLAQCVQVYFEQSEQLATHLILFNGVEQDQFRAAGLLLQVLPTGKTNENEGNDAFHHLSTLADTLTNKEVFNLNANEILRRLYHQEDVRLYEPVKVSFKCSCSRERSAAALANVDKVELLNIVAQEGQINMNCQYCHTEYCFDGIDVEAIHARTFGNQSHQQ